MKEKTAELKEKIEKDYKDMMAVINSTSLPLFVEDTIEDMYILIKTLIAENKELKEEVERQSNTREIEEKYMEDNFISKNEIKEEIQELKNIKIDGEVFKTAVNYAIKILQSLLGKE